MLGEPILIMSLFVQAILYTHQLPKHHVGAPQHAKCWPSTITHNIEHHFETLGTHNFLSPASHHHHLYLIMFYHLVCES